MVAASSRILERLAALPSPVIDRAIEKLFRVRRRRAIELLNTFGGFQTGKTFLIDRLELIAQLERLRDGEEFQIEDRRRTRLLEDLERHFQDLPAGVRLQPGELRIEFFGAEDLLRHLYELSQAITNDYAAFQQRVENSA